MSWIQNATVGIVLAVLALSGCGGGASSNSPSTSGKFEQTWSKSYGSTTCSDFGGTMTADQRRVAAADMLTGARNQDGGKTLPSDDLIRTFMGAIDNACVQPTMTITDVAVGVYLTDRARFQP